MIPPISTLHVSEIAITILPDGRMDRKNAALYCGLSEKTLAMHACRGTGPDFVKRGKVFYFREDVDRWFSEGQPGATPSIASSVFPAGVSSASNTSSKIRSAWTAARAVSRSISARDNGRTSLRTIAGVI
jgi:hypothetical protein